MKKYDLHVHSYYSKCSNLKPLTILKTAKELGLDGIAITDHDTFKGAQLISKLNKDKDFEVIKGIELSTDKSHLLAIYMEEEIKTDNFFEALDKIKEQDGIAVIAHPFSCLRGCLRADITKIKNKANLETYNGRAFGFENKKAELLAKKYSIPQTAGSDAHFKFEIGRGVTLFEDDLKSALKKRKTATSGRHALNLLGPALSFINKRI